MALVDDARPSSIPKFSTICRKYRSQGFGLAPVSPWEKRIDSMEVYLDNHASTRCAPEVVEAMLPFFDVDYANPSALSSAAGRRVHDAVEAARASLAEMIGCRPSELIFTSGATESNNLAIGGILSRLDRGHVCATAIEHSSVRGPMREWGRRGFQVDEIGVDAEGRVTPDALREALKPDTRLVSIMAANNEIGTIQDFQSLVPVVRETDALLHVDATQAIGKIPWSLRELDIDLLTFSAHKLHGPKGIGALVVRQGGRRVRLQPQVWGGGHERGFRSGTLNVPGIIGLHRAVQLAFDDLATIHERVRSLRDKFWELLRERIPGLILNGPPLEGLGRLWNNLHCQFPGVEGQTLSLACPEVAMSSGSACSANQTEPSHVLLAIGLSPDQARSSLRFGLSRYTTREEIDSAAAALADAFAQLRND